MSIDLNLISKVVEEKNLPYAYQLGVRADFIEGSERELWKFIEEFYKSYKDIPSKDIIKQKFDLELPASTDSLEFWAKEVMERALHRAISDLSFKVDKKLIDSKPSDAFEEMRTFVRAQLDLRSSNTVMTPLSALVDQLKQDYIDAKAGKTGILTPWNKMNEWTMGWFPGDVTWFSARLGVGKTFLALILAASARFQSNKKVLFISGEMNKADIAKRLLAIQSKLPYGGVRKGRLGEFLETQYFDKLEAARSENDFEIMDASLGFRSQDLELALDKSDAELVVVDAAYRIKAFKKTKDRFENMAEVADDLKTLALRYKKPILATTQLNRDSTKKKSYGDEDVALSDVVGWNATNLFALKQDEENKEKRVMQIFPLKVREGENARDPLEINWDMMHMNFTEYSFAPPPSRPTANDDDSWL